MRSNPHKIIKHYFTSTDLNHFDQLEYQTLEQGAITIDIFTIHADVYKDPFAINVLDQWLCEITNFQPNGKYSQNDVLSWFDIISQYAASTLYRKINNLITPFRENENIDAAIELLYDKI